jgi:isoleucyl-tRNA synthetase
MTTPASNAKPLTTQPDGAKAEKAGEEKSRYRATLNLPKTSFPMKANLIQNEPASIKRWATMDERGLYAKLRDTSAGKPKFVFHDGPPYANGSIHLGHLLNKSLKDFVVRSRTMMGLDCAFIPGWDCHGLPIEHKVMTELVENKKYDKLKDLPEDQRRMAIRRECQKYADKFVKLHIQQMTRALTLADYEHPYLTMQPSFEGATLEVLATLTEQGLVYRALKPVHWSIANETALAEAELEYEDREDVSVYVDFEAIDADKIYDAFDLPQAAMDEDEDEETPGTGVVPSHTPGTGAGPEARASNLPKPGVRPTIRPSFMIWTTTPWTLPANLAIAINPQFQYALVAIDGNITIMASRLVEKVTTAAKSQDVVVLATTTGDRLLGLRYKHPFVPSPPLPTGERSIRASESGEGTNSSHAAVFSIVAADYVTLDDGTGLVHTAPGHGTEDYQTGLRVGLPIYCPVRYNGTYDSTVPEWLRGLDIWKANGLVVDRLRQSGHLFYDHTFTHSYPHDWRSKTPVIFRCTEQWFVGVDTPTKRDGQSLRALALANISPDNSANVRFVPEWGRNRMRGMLESRPDWCISRQRAWGLPIPAFFFTDAQGTEHTLMTPATIRAVAKLVREKGADVWFQSTPEQLLLYWDPESDRDLPDWWKTLARNDPVPSSPSPHLSKLRKGPDILDVWFESGSTWNAVMRERSGGQDFPIELYLEGADQHRGWFQSSLLPALGMMGRPPFKALLTHGFTVDKDGRKLSKSSGDTIEALYDNYGVDVLRWWVSSLSYENDMKVDREFFDLAGESYRKVRNTIRFMLSNLDDFQCSGPGQPGHCISISAIKPTSIDAWALGEFDKLSRDVIAAYERYDFQAAHKAIYDYCNDTLSATYLAAIKDRLYCDKADAPRRRQTQTALWDLTDGLCRLLAPIMPHTADEAFRALHKADAKDSSVCVHLHEFIRSTGAKAETAWPKVMDALKAAQIAMEKAKAATGAGGLSIDNPLDMGVTLPDPAGDLARFDAVDLADILGVSRVTLDRAAPSPRITDLRAEPRCERSWKRDGTVKARVDGGLLSDRDAHAVGVA